jgi:hypothetical protein
MAKLHFSCVAMENATSVRPNPAAVAQPDFTRRRLYHQFFGRFRRRGNSMWILPSYFPRLACPRARNAVEAPCPRLSVARSIGSARERGLLVDGLSNFTRLRRFARSRCSRLMLACRNWVISSVSRLVAKRVESGTVIPSTVGKLHDRIVDEAVCPRRSESLSNRSRPRWSARSR